MTEPAWPARIELPCEPVTALDLALFAAASGDHNLLHLDLATARAAGFDRPVVHGMLSMAYAARLCTSHFGAGCVAHLQTRFTGIAKLGDAIVLHGTLARVDGPLAVYDLAARTQDGTGLMTGTARLARKTLAKAQHLT
ncbi:MaoC/PaaZ C-terminal domain-containing protein [Variovorax sp. dw_954]|uniref:MaoC family dehydratase n=1 Tax=Variovorax sp. dw_954 TaxID=2720078 RepID=UPI001BD5C60E|nr:MaoC/PaaZ C-terminal domain-containing protein [Variovorax sp. dw_954]